MKYIPFLVLLVIIIPSPCMADRTSPVDKGRITSGVGWRQDPFGSGKMMYHRGYDIAVPTGTPVYSVRPGTVYYAGPYKGYGNLVAVDHGNGYLTLYGHNTAVKVTRGQRVDDKTVIALAGSTGRSTGPHVHYELRRMGAPDKQRVAQRDAQLKKKLITLINTDIHEWVEGIVSGDNAGGEEIELFLGDIDE